jgi:hypothetical protein
MLLQGPDGGGSVTLFEAALAVLAASAIIGTVVLGRRLEERRKGNFESVIARWRGHLDPTTPFPVVFFQVEGVQGELTFNVGGGEGGRGWTQAHFNWSSGPRLRVRTGKLAAWLKSLLGSRKIRTGDEAFDSEFWIETTDEPWAQHLLTSPVRAELRFLRQEKRWYSPNGVTLDLGPAGLRLNAERMLRDDRDSLNRFIEAAVLILQQARGGPGIVVQALSTGGGCPVCGHEVDGGHPCPRCRTPHHEDCWTYFGGCAIFGCHTR